MGKRLIISENEKKDIRKLYYESPSDDDPMGLMNNDEFMKIIADGLAGKITPEEAEMRIKILLLTDSVKPIKEIFEEYPDVAEKINDSDVIRILKDTIRTANDDPHSFFIYNHVRPVEDLSDLQSKHIYGEMIIDGVIEKFVNVYYPELDYNDFNWKSDLINYIKFYHDDLLFEGFNKMNF